MRSRLAVAITVAALASGCADTPESDPFAPTLAAINVCQTNTVRQAAGRYFGSGADQQAAFDLVKAMQQAPNAAARQSAAFNLLGMVGTVTDAGRQTGTPQQGSDLVNAVLGCTGYGTPGLVNFVPALSPGGAFAVRGGAADGAGAVLARFDPLWGVEPTAGSSWPAATGAVRTLIYGDTIGNFDTDEMIVGGTGFDWSRIPAGAFAEPVRVGYCYDQGPDRALIQHHEDSNSDAVVLPPETLSFCGSSVSLGAGMFAALASGPGGRVGTFSPFVAVDAQVVALTFAQQPVSTTTGLLPAVSVLVTGVGGTPIEGVEVAMTVAGNRGSFTFGGDAVQVTNADGIATFGDLTLDKPGGYTFTATAQHWFFDGSAATSALFNLQFP